MPRQDEFGRDIQSDDDSDRSRSPPRRLRRERRSRSDSPGPRRRSSRSRSPPRRARDDFRRVSPERRRSPDRGQRRFSPPRERRHSPPRIAPREAPGLGYRGPPGGAPGSSAPPPRNGGGGDSSGGGGGNSSSSGGVEAGGAAREGSGYGHRNNSTASKAPLQGTEPFKSFAAWRASSEGEAAAAAAKDSDEVDAKLKEGFEAYQTAYVATLTEALENEACDNDWFSNRYDPTKRLAIRDAAMQRKASAAQRVTRAVRNAARLGNEQDAACGKDGAPPASRAGAAAAVASSMGPHRTAPPAPGADHAAALAGSLSAVPLAAAASLGCAKRDRRGDLEQPPPLQSLPCVQDAEAKGRLVTLRRIPPWCPRDTLLAALEAAARDTGASDADEAAAAATEVPDGSEPAAAAASASAVESPPLVEQFFVSDASKGRGKAYHAAAWVLYSSAEAAARAAPRAGTAVAALAAGFAPPPGMGFSSSLVAAAGLAPVGKPLDGLEVCWFLMVVVQENTCCIPCFILSPALGLIGQIINIAAYFFLLVSFSFLYFHTIVLFL